MMKIILVLPGSTDYDAQGRIQGTLDIPLSEHGTREVDRVIDELRGQKIEVVYASDSEPARGTAEAIAAALGVRHKTLDDMQNLNHGLWQGLLVDDVRRKQPKVYRQWQEQPDSVHPPQGETVAEAGERVDAALRRVLKKHKEGTIALVVPEPLASLVRSRITHDEMGDLWRACTTGHGCWEALDVAANGLNGQHAHSPVGRHAG